MIHVIASMGTEGLVIVYTGGGKGKTTAALGMALRAVGHKKRVCMIQFIKGSWHYGELDSSKLLKPYFELSASGQGFVGIIDDKSEKSVHIKAAKRSLQQSLDKLEKNEHDIIILDEINYATNLELISVNDVLKLVKSKPKELTLVLTGNHADPRIIELADLVTEMKEIKHPFKSGIKAKKGIDF